MNRGHIAGYRKGGAATLILKKLLWIPAGCLHWLLGRKGCDMAALPPGKPSCFKGGRERSRTAPVLQLFAEALLLMRSLPALKAGLTVCYNLH